MPTAVFFNCRGCNARIKAPVHYLGTYRNCPGCNTRVMVCNQPRPDAASAPPGKQAQQTGAR